MATINALVTGLQTALTTGSTPLFSTTTCFFGFDPEATLAYPPSDQYVVICPKALKVRERVFRGNANVGWTWSLGIDLWVFVRLSTDESMRDDLYLSDMTNGTLALTDSIVNALQDYVFTDNGNQWGYELDDIGWQRKNRESIGWGSAVLSYHTDLTARSQ